MKVLIVSATEFEIIPVREFVAANNLIEVHFCVTGVGVPNTIFTLSQKAPIFRLYDLVINVGIAGCYNYNYSLGDVFNITHDTFGDLGAESKEGMLIDLFEMELEDNSIYDKGKLVNQNAVGTNFLPLAEAITVNKAHGSASSIVRVQKKYPNITLESMEGAAFFYVMKRLEVDSYLQIRSISNYVEPRNKDNWNIPLAIEELNKVLISLIK